MPIELLLSIVAILIIANLLLAWWIFSRKKKISEGEKQKILSHIHFIEIKDLRTQVLEYDKILDACLKALQVKGETLGERMKKYKNFYNTNAIWNAHKLRNQLAHEIQFHPSDKEMQKAVESFQKEIKRMLER